jgi:uroporphyrinogen-III synthase
VTRLVLYRTERQREQDLLVPVPAPLDAIVFTSPSGVDAFFALPAPLRPVAARTVALGPTTAEVLRRHGIAAVGTPSSPAAHDLIQELVRHDVATPTPAPPQRAPARSGGGDPALVE